MGLSSLNALPIFYPSLTMKKKKQGKRKHIPMRTCIICREKTDKRQLTRIVRTETGSVEVDRTGKKNGRGAYICGKIGCWETAVQSKRLDQALKTDITDEQKSALWAQKPGAVEEWQTG